MARATWRHAFDRDRDFFVRRPLTIGGKSFAAGDPFDKTLVPTRRLHQLFDSHRIMFADAPLPGANRGSNLSGFTGVAGPAAGVSIAADLGDVIPIPGTWRELPWIPKVKGGESLRSFAGQFTDKPLGNKAEAFAIVEAEVARREAAKQPEPPVIEHDADQDASEDGAIVIPDEWRELSIDERIALAVALTGEAIGADEDATAAIELEIESRKAETDGQSA